MQRHEAMASLFLESESISTLLRKDWGIRSSDVCELLSPVDKKNPRFRLLSSLLSGPIDVDKLDYLDRDSLHAGVPYGRNFDRSRLISQLCLTPDGQSLAITEKARTAAEMMVFARYVMFSEVYWHHTVRAATAMLQRAIWGLLSDEESTVESPMGHFVNDWGKLSEHAFIGRLRTIAKNTPHADLVEGLFGDHRSIYKCIGEYHCQESPTLHDAIARMPYSDLQDLAYKLSEKITQETCIDIQSHELIIDAPPPKLEVQFKIEVRQSSGKFVQLGELSPVIQTLTTQQFDNLVKRVRIFVKPELREALENKPIQEYLSMVMR
jgi:HD superfamily phosphohydrolase